MPTHAGPASNNGTATPPAVRAADPTAAAANTDHGKPKVVLAYSGGLDTSVAIGWLQGQGFDVIALTLDLGQDAADLEAVLEKATALGCIDAVALDVKQDFVDAYLTPAIWANAKYGDYPLATALGRPLIAKALVETAQHYGAEHIAHGCTAKGNDQVRIEVAAAALDPTLTTIAPMREWTYGRDEAIAYANERGIPVPVQRGQAYSIDENLWGRSVECGILEDPAIEPPEDVYAWTTASTDAPERPQTITIGFKHGIPNSLDGEPLSLLAIIQRLTTIAGAHGIGRIDQIEDRLVGIKSREIYEAPAAITIMEAHKSLESLTLTKEVQAFQKTISASVAQLTYDGLWFSPLMSAHKAFLANAQQHVNGTVTLRLYKGTVTTIGRTSPNALYTPELATYGANDKFDHAAASGFITVWGYPAQIQATAQKSTETRQKPIGAVTHVTTL